MRILKGDAVEEVTALLAQLQEDDEVFKNMEKMAKEERAGISKQVKDLAQKLGGGDERVLLPAGENQYWDRRISGNAERIDLDVLKETVGLDTWKKLCDRVVIFELNENKVRTALEKGIITEQDLIKAVYRTKKTFSLYRIDRDKVTDEDDEE